MSYTNPYNPYGNYNYNQPQPGYSNSYYNQQQNPENSDFEFPGYPTETSNTGLEFNPVIQTLNPTLNLYGYPVQNVPTTNGHYPYATAYGCTQYPSYGQPADSLDFEAYNPTSTYPNPNQSQYYPSNNPFAGSSHTNNDGYNGGYTQAQYSQSTSYYYPQSVIVQQTTVAPQTTVVVQQQETLVEETKVVVTEDENEDGTVTITEKNITTTESASDAIVRKNAEIAGLQAQIEKMMLEQEKMLKDHKNVLALANVAHEETFMKGRQLGADAEIFAEEMARLDAEKTALQKQLEATNVAYIRLLLEKESSKK